tara:strand:- start:210 stop:1415 length:1206 start_codon:yes stop_codon:yes gene_type:complete
VSLYFNINIFLSREKENFRMNIGIIGVGKLGLSYALVFEEVGYNVIASSYKQEYVEQLQHKQIDTVEPGVKSRLHASKNIEFTTDNHRVISECDYIYVMVATPSNPDGTYDISAVEKVADDFLAHPGDVSNTKLIIGCTTNPGDTAKIQEKLNRRSVKVLYSPTFVAQGNVIDRIYNPDGTLIGTLHTQEAEECKKIFQPIQKNNAPFTVVQPTTAEILKITFNCLMTLRISFNNQIGKLAIESGMEEDLDAINFAMDTYDRNMKFSFGYGYGGPCLPRDNIAMTQYAKSIGSEYVFGEIVDLYNNNHSEFLAQWFIKNNPNNLPYYFDYITYKPGVNLTDTSQQYEFCKKLLDAGHVVYINPSDFLPEQFIAELTVYDTVAYQTKEELEENNIDFYNVDL